jgi:hypothetical protein
MDYWHHQDYQEALVGVAGEGCPLEMILPNQNDLYPKVEILSSEGANMNFANKNEDFTSEICGDPSLV